VDELVDGNGALDLAHLDSLRHRTLQQRERMLARHEQRLIDAETGAARRALMRALRRRGGAHIAIFLDDDFLTEAARPTVYGAIVDAAVTLSRAASVDLQLVDRGAGVLRMAAQCGFTSRFLECFDAVDAAQPTACAAALASRRPVLVEDVTRSPIFIGQPSLERIVDAGSRAVHSYPLLAADGTSSVCCRSTTATARLDRAEPSSSRFAPRTRSDGRCPTAAAGGYEPRSRGWRAC
jgi:hypothetical protein